MLLILNNLVEQVAQRAYLSDLIYYQYRDSKY